MTIGELFEKEKIDRDFMWDRFDDEPYWAKAKSFIEDNWNTNIESMSLKQGAWVTKILDDCVEKRIEGK